jgi:hypothetical protein
MFHDFFFGHHSTMFAAQFNEMFPTRIRGEIKKKLSANERRLFDRMLAGKHPADWKQLREWRKLLDAD